jgi:hypothetical protein
MEELKAFLDALDEEQWRSSIGIMDSATFTQ